MFNLTTCGLETVYGCDCVADRTGLNSCKQLDNCLKDAYKSPLLTCVLKHCVSHQEPHITPCPLRPFQFARGGSPYPLLLKPLYLAQKLLYRDVRTLFRLIPGTFYITNYLRTTVDGVARVYRRIARCLGTTIVSDLESSIKNWSWRKFSKLEK